MPRLPTFDEMLHPQRVDAHIRAEAERARTEDPLHPINLFNIHWRRPGSDAINYLVMPHEITGVEAEIVVMVAKDFPTGSHKVGPAKRPGRPRRAELGRCLGSHSIA
ncbi:MAG: hypothetical protein NZ693_00820, partial [Thermoflexales bacterium]|nr:hypothetical protein [Thermoflexales bacterium]